MSATEIIREGLKNGDSYEVINKKLAENGCTFKLVERENIGWTEQEMKEGFIPAATEAKDVVHLADLMKRDEKLAGTDVDMLCKEGHYRITRDENGYAI